MDNLQAGVGRQKITPKIGTPLYGYFDRLGPSTGVHDDLWARALVLDDGDTQIALCSVELCVFRAREVALVRQAVAERCALLPENIFLFATHSHAAPSGHNPNHWHRPLTDLIADAIVQAYESRQPACIGIGAGFLFGHNINRRWLDRPADPALGVVRVEKANGEPLALLGNYACHAVVLGSNNLLISGDWPGYASRQLEAELGGDIVALFSQGGAGDVNPLTESVRQRLTTGQTVGTIGDITAYYGNQQVWNVEDRRDGTFADAEGLARVFSDEALRVWHGIQPTDDLTLWIERVVVNGAVGSDEPAGEGLSDDYRAQMPEIRDGYIPLELVVAGIGHSVLIGHPGETFSEDSIAIRRACQQMGYDYSMLLTYANGSYGYLPPANAHNEGGYEVSWPRRFGISRHVQEWMWEAIQPILERHIPS